MPLHDFEAYETGHPGIDSDHRRLAQTVEMIARAMATGSAEMCLDLVRLFLRALEDHFRREEEWLHQLGYPEAERHAAFHARLLAQGRAIGASCEGMRREELSSCFERIVSLFVEDVVRGDHAFLSWFQENGIAGRPLHRR